MNPVLVVLLVLLGLLVLLLLLRVGGKVEFSDEGLSVRVRVGPVYYRVYPKKQKKKPAEELKPVTSTAKKAEEAQPPPAEKPGGEPSAPAPGEQKPDEGAEQPVRAEPSAGGEQPVSEEQPAAAQAPPAAQTEGKSADSPPPGRKAKPSKRRKKAAKQPKETGKTGGRLELAMALAPDLLKLLERVVHRLRVDELTLEYTIPGRWDAAGAAMQYGIVYSTGGVLCPLLSQNLRVKRLNVGAEIDFQEEIARVYVCLNLSYQVWELLILGLRALRIYLKLKKRNNVKKGQ